MARKQDKMKRGKKAPSYSSRQAQALQKILEGFVIKPALINGVVKNKSATIRGTNLPYNHMIEINFSKAKEYRNKKQPDRLPYPRWKALHESDERADGEANFHIYELLETLAEQTERYQARNTMVIANVYDYETGERVFEGITLSNTANMEAAFLQAAGEADRLSDKYDSAYVKSIIIQIE